MLSELQTVFPDSMALSVLPSRKASVIGGMIRHGCAVASRRQAPKAMVQPLLIK